VLRRLASTGLPCLLLVGIAWAALAVISLASAKILFPPGGAIIGNDQLVEKLAIHPVLEAVRYVAVVVLTLVASISLFRMQRRGWLLAIIAAVIGLAVQLAAWYGGSANFFLMALAVVVVFLMNETEVRDAFRPEAPR